MVRRSRSARRTARRGSPSSPDEPRGAPPSRSDDQSPEGRPRFRAAIEPSRSRRTGASMIDESGRPRAACRDYDRAEIAVDGVVHAVALVLGVTGAAVLIAFAARMPGARDLPVSIVYVSGLLAMLVSGGLQSLAGVTHQMAAAPLRSLGDLSADCRDL